MNGLHIALLVLNVVAATGVAVTLCTSDRNRGINVTLLVLNVASAVWQITRIV
jgi:hypothetical protein